MTFAGDLQGMSLADVFQTVAQNRTSGTLHVVWPKGERLVRFTDGKISALAFGSTPGPLLLDHVIERGMVTAPALPALKKRLQRSKVGAGRVMVAAEIVTAEQLPQVLSEMVAENSYDLLSLKDARFTFKDGPEPDGTFDPDQLAADIHHEVGPLLLEGARRADDWQRIRAVIGSDQDLFLAEGGGGAAPATDVAAALLPHLDGRTDLPQLCAHVGKSRFEVAAALAALVQQGLARPARAEEISSFATQLLADDDARGAATLLRAALERRPRDTELRTRLAEALASTGQPTEAASEWAVLAGQAGEAERWPDALACCERALQLQPTDVMFHQRRCELLARTGDAASRGVAHLAWVDALCALSLHDRARSVLTIALDGPLRGEPTLLRRLAVLATELGDPAEASKRWLQLAAQHQEDTDEHLEFLRLAAAQRPDDKALVQRLVDLQTGRTASRAKKHKLFAVGAGAAALVLLLLFATLCELAAARQLATALRGQVADGDGVRTQTALRVVAEDHPWLPSGLAAAATAQQQAITLLHRADHLLLTGDCDAAETLLRVALPELRGRDHAHAEHLLARVGGERPLHAWLARVEARGRDDGEAA